MTDTSRDVVEFLARYPPSVRDVALEAQRTIRMDASRIAARALAKSDLRLR